MSESAGSAVREWENERVSACSEAVRERAR